MIFLKCLISDIFQATINKSADKEAIGKNDKYVAKNEIDAKINNEWITEDIFDVAPDFTFTTVLAIAAVAGIPPKNGTIIFVIPYPINSLLGLVLCPVIPSLITAHNSDSRAPKIAIAILCGRSL